MAFGDTITLTDLQRGVNGYIDDFQLYDQALGLGQIGSLYANPGSVIPEPTTLALLFAGSLGLIRRKK